MNFKEAKEKLGRIASGRYYTINYEVTCPCGTYETQECRLYIDGYSHLTASTWDEAFRMLDVTINPALVDVDPVEELEEPDEPADLDFERELDQDSRNNDLREEIGPSSADIYGQNS